MLSVFKINSTYTFVHPEEMVDVFLVFSGHKKGWSYFQFKVCK